MRAVRVAKSSGQLPRPDPAAQTIAGVWRMLSVAAFSPVRSACDARLVGFEVCLPQPTDGRTRPASLGGARPSAFAALRQTRRLTELFARHCLLIWLQGPSGRQAFRARRGPGRSWRWQRCDEAEQHWHLPELHAARAQVDPRLDPLAASAQELHRCGVRIVAHGVGSVELLAWALKLGCDLVLGERVGASCSAAELLQRAAPYP